MGQTGSNILTDIPAILPETLGTLNTEIRGKSKLFQELNQLTYEDFKKYVEEINELSKNCMFVDGRQLVFTIKNGTESSFLWKATIRIACIKFNPTTKRIESCTILNLKQFIQLFKTFQSHLETMIATEKQQLTQSFHQTLLNNVYGAAASNDLDANAAEECCICLDRKSDLILPCLHLFCQACIEQWNMNSKTCPVCQEKLDSAEEGWVISEIPEAADISNEIRDCLQYISDGK